MLGVAMMMQASLMTGYFRNGSEPKPHGNKQPFATNSAYDAKEGMVMIGASNIGQQARFWRAVERADMIKTDNEARLDDREREAGIIADIIKTKTADEWEVYFQARHVPAARVRTMAEALADPHFTERPRVPQIRRGRRHRRPARGAARRVQVRAWRTHDRAPAARDGRGHRHGPR